MLSRRGGKSAVNQDIPWRFAPGGDNRYDAVSNPSGVIPFGTAENNLVLAEMQQFITQNVTIPVESLTYRYADSGAFESALAAHMNEHFQPHKPVSPDQILTSAGLTGMHSLLAYALGDPGDGILVTRPIYGRFELDFVNVAGLIVVKADMLGIDSFESEVVACYQEAFNRAKRAGTNIRAALIVNPHNPLGRCYPKSTLIGIMKFCESKEIHLISDEVYALSVFDTDAKEATKFTSVLSIDPEGLIAPERLHALYGMSKDFAAAGLRLGSLITRNALLKKSVNDNARFHSPSGPTVAMGTAILSDRAFVHSFLQLNQMRLGEAYRYTTSILTAAGIKYHENGNAGFFVYLDLRPWLRPVAESDETNSAPEYALARNLLDGGVGLHPCEEHNEVVGYFRLVFTQERQVLQEGLRRLISVLESIA